MSEETLRSTVESIKFSTATIDPRTLLIRYCDMVAVPELRFLRTAVILHEDGLREILAALGREDRVLLVGNPSEFYSSSAQRFPRLNFQACGKLRVDSLMRENLIILLTQGEVSIVNHRDPKRGGSIGESPLWRQWKVLAAKMGFDLKSVRPRACAKLLT